jgi:hypothetical protein
VPQLFRRREVWLPTAWGALLLLAAATLLALTALRGLGGFLAVEAPAAGRDGHGARVLVVEGWLEEDALAEAIGAIGRGHYEHVVASGGPIENWRQAQLWPTYADRAADYLRRHGVAAIAVPAPASTQDRSFLSAMVVRDWLRAHGLGGEAIDVYSAGVHARRSRLVYRLAFGREADVGIRAAVPQPQALDRWWTGSETAKTTIGELLGLMWTECCFWPPPAGSHEERWAQPKSPA